MAKIQVTGESSCVVTLSEPDEEGDYSWTSGCAETQDAYRPLDETINDAIVHVDIQCRWAGGRPEAGR
jgi:hypothetical protein